MHHSSSSAPCCTPPRAPVVRFLSSVRGTTRTAGLLKTIGNILGIWLFILAVVALVGGILAHGMGRHHGWGMQPAANASERAGGAAQQ